MNPQLISAIAFPFLMIFGAIAAWRISRTDSTKPDTPSWRDDSLDEWRKERDQQAEQARASRPAEQQHLATGSEEQQDTKKQHQRLGG
ncbi:MAG: hypothetical protein AB7J35_19765 [Dehalococcoidia bacterium]